MINPLKLKSADIRAAMAKRWTAPEWAIMWEVGQGTGSMSGRYADAVMMSLWPSRGLELHGVEIKVSRADWRREATDPTKAEAIAKYCHRWWIHTPEGVIDDVSDMPPAWGLREWTGKKWITRKDAEKTEAMPISYPFLAAMLRRSDESARTLARAATEKERDGMKAERADQLKRHHSEVKREVERITYAAKQKQDRIDALNEMFGEDFMGWAINHKMLARTALRLSKLDSKHLLELAATMAGAAEGLGDAAINVDVEEKVE